MPLDTAELVEVRCPACGWLLFKKDNPVQPGKMIFVKEIPDNDIMGLINQTRKIEAKCGRCKIVHKINI